MNTKQIEKIREKYPIGFDEICRYSSFEQILGRKDSNYTSEERKLRWNKAMSLSMRKTKKEWTDTQLCQGWQIYHVP